MYPLYKYQKQSLQICYVCSGNCFNPLLRKSYNGKGESFSYASKKIFPRGGGGGRKKTSKKKKQQRTLPALRKQKNWGGGGGGGVENNLYKIEDFFLIINVYIHKY